MALGWGCGTRESATSPEPAPAADLASGAATQQLCAVVQSGDSSQSRPLYDFDVHLFTADQSGFERVETKSTKTLGKVCFTFNWPTAFDAIVYMTAQNQDDGQQTLATVLGYGDRSLQSVVINEATTVATAYAMAQFIDPSDPDAIFGPAPGLRNAVTMGHNLADPVTGDAGPTLLDSSNLKTTTLSSFNSLANMIAGCLGTPSSCDQFLQLAQIPEAPGVGSTFQAMASIARKPHWNAQPLYSQSTVGPTPYAPALVHLPEGWAWTLALRFIGVPGIMNGPGNFAIDADGNLYVANNYTVAPICDGVVAGSELLPRFKPNGEGMEPFKHGGLYGAGFGIDIDPSGNIWVASFGFKGRGCKKTPPDYDEKMARFKPAGEPDPNDGITHGKIKKPQGTLSNAEGDVWVANCGSHSVTKFPGGTILEARNFTPEGLESPFDIAFNSFGDVFVTSNGNNQVFVLDQWGTPTATSPISGGGLARPMGIASDSQGNLWVANSQVLDAPCPIGDLRESEGGTLTWIRPDGTLAENNPFDGGVEGGGLSIPWGVAVDSQDNVWVANFADQRLSHFCGARCAAPGTPIAPHGYAFDGLERNTAVAIDPSGNVWLTNNWKLGVPDLKDPGGRHIVAFVGLAPPVLPGHRPD